MGNKTIGFYLITVLSAVVYFYLFYFIERPESLILMSSYTLLFGFYLFLIRQRPNLSVGTIVLLAIGLRLLSITSLPALSDDFYRFIWDGRLWLSGINPFALLPVQVIDTPIFGTNGLSEQLYNLLNSPTHYTVYPPIPQFINLLSAYLASDSILISTIIMRVFIIAADLIAIYFIIKLLKQANKDPKLVVLYALNPLVIIELAGNLHHEAFMIAFFLGSVYYLNQHKALWSGVFLALSITSKLLPLLFLPYILIKLNAKNRLKLLLSLAITAIILFLPLIDQSFVIGMKDSLTLYYQKFEFNASLYYLARAIGYGIYGYNAIAIIGKIFFIGTTLLILGLSYRFYLKGTDNITGFLLLYFIFCILSLILHPWYILLLIALTPLSPFRFPVGWSFLIFFTYVGYSDIGYSENYYIVAAEYLLLALAFLFDLKNYIRSSETLKAAP
jgi:alpha-1,6-mannosyltransferase